MRSMRILRMQADVLVQTSQRAVGQAVSPVESLLLRRPPPQLVEEVQQKGHANVPLSFATAACVRQYRKPPAVGSCVVVQVSSRVLKSLIGPQVRLARDEGFVLDFIICRHDLVVQILEE